MSVPLIQRIGFQDAFLPDLYPEENNNQNCLRLSLTCAQRSFLQSGQKVEPLSGPWSQPAYQEGCPLWWEVVVLVAWCHVFCNNHTMNGNDFTSSWQQVLRLRSNGVMFCEQWTGNDLEGSVHGLIKLLSEKSEESHVKPFFSWGEMRLSPLCTSATVWHYFGWWMMRFTWPYLGSNPGHRDGKPATNCLSYGMAILNLSQESWRVGRASPRAPAPPRYKYRGILLHQHVSFPFVAEDIYGRRLL
jgi:hypothetical protein